MIEFAMTQNTKAKGMQLFPYLSVLVQEFDVSITTDVVLRLIRFFSHLTATETAASIAETAEDEDDRSTEQYLHRATEHVAKANRQSKIYFQDFTLHPIHLHLTLKMTDLGDEVKRNPLFRALSKLGITILNVDDASMRFYAIKLEDTIVT
jgi:Vacuolar-sorting-associated 13 protein C-terminal